MRIDHLAINLLLACLIYGSLTVEARAGDNSCTSAEKKRNEGKADKMFDEEDLARSKYIKLDFFADDGKHYRKIVCDYLYVAQIIEAKRYDFMNKNSSCFIRSKEYVSSSLQQYKESFLSEHNATENNGYCSIYGYKFDRFIRH